MQGTAYTLRALTVRGFAVTVAVILGSIYNVRNYLHYLYKKQNIPHTVQSSDATLPDVSKINKNTPW